MHPFISKAPDWKDHQQVLPQVDLPREFLGSSIQWKPQYKSTPIFIEQFLFSSFGDIYLFGVRFDLDQSIQNGLSRFKGFFIEYLIIEYSTESPTLHRLSQNGEVVYSSVHTTKDYIGAAELDEQEVSNLCLNAKPRWKMKDAQWPTFENKPMNFLGQTALPKNQKTQKLLTSNTSVFLFWKKTSTGSLFKITTQDVIYQSADEHYAIE